MSLVVVYSTYCPINWAFVSPLSTFVSLICSVHEETSRPGQSCTVRSSLHRPVDPIPLGYCLPTGHSVDNAFIIKVPYLDVIILTTTL